MTSLAKQKSFRFVLTLLVVAVLLPACATLGENRVGGAVAHWRTGGKAHALKMARAEYMRFRGANIQDVSRFKSTVTSIRTTLSETPTPVLGDAMTPQPGAAKGPHTLSKLLRQDLFSTQATRVLRATMTVGQMKLRHHALELIHIVYGRRVYHDKGGPLEGHSKGVRTMVVKAFALKALAALAQ
jgi:hypothetical protein